MELTISLTGIFLCLLVLTISGKYLVNISTRLAKVLGVSDIIIGTTLVALTTGAPTLVVSIIAFLSNQPDIALGNLIGTNYVNLGLALGIPAFMTTILVKQEVFEKEIPIYFSMTALFTSFLLDRHISFVEGALLLLFLIAAWLIIVQYGFHHNERLAIEKKEQTLKLNDAQNKKDILSIVLLIFILIIASIGITLLTPMLSSSTGINNYLLGLTLIGVGTSIPTIVAGIIAAKHGNTDIIVGNVFGGNILNIGLGIAVLAMIQPITVNESIANDLSFVNLYGAVVVILVLAEMKLLGRNKVLSRLSGLIMILGYLIYTAFAVISNI